MDAMTLERQGEDWRLSLAGDWSLAALAKIDRELKGLPSPMGGNLICDWSHAEAPGIGPVWALMSRVAEVGTAGLSVRHEGGPPDTVELLHKLASEQRAAPAAPAPEPEPAGAFGKLDRLGRWVVTQGIEARGVLEFMGRVSEVVAQSFSRLRALRMPSIARHVYETGIKAIAIVSLIAFLISVVVAYLGAQQLARFGANIFVVDLVALTVLREMGVLLTAIIVAGRSGSAFAAELGVMQLNEETDALRAMGMNPIELLVLPRVLGLIIALPALTIIADAMGLAGGGLLSMLDLHIPPPQFMARLREAISETTFWAGLIKAPVFAVIIGVVGCYRGMQVRESARELGRLTTVAVVQAIFFVIFADALFAVFYQKIDF